VARAAGGHDRWFLVGGAPIHDTAGNVTGGVIVYRDTTERRILGQQIRWQASMLERAHDAIFMWELDGPIVYWNHGAELLYGYSSEEAVGQLSHKLLQTERPVSPELFKKALKRTGEWIGDIRHTTRDGRCLVVESRHQLLREAGGRTYVLEVCRDITERLNLEAEVRMSEMRLRLALDAAAMGTFIWHVAEDRTESDAQMLALFGLGPDGAITLAQALAALIHPQDKNRYAEAVARATDSEGDGALREDIRIILPDSSQRWLAVVGQVFFEGEPRRPTHMAGAVTNITDRKDAEEALERARNELEQRVRERTSELAGANRSLGRLSRQVLEVQETERRRIARELHDEIGQALTGAKMMLESLDEQLRWSNNGAASAEALSHDQTPLVLKQLGDVYGVIGETLEHVRDLSLDLRPAILDSLGLLPAVLWHFERYTRQTGVQVHFHHRGLVPLDSDIEIGVYRIVQEALTNVARYADVSRVTVQLVADDQKLHLYVVDEGAGFDAEEAMAAGRSTGMAGMRERATLLGGDFLVSSTPGEGTTIEVELPLPRGGTSRNKSERKPQEDAL